MPLSVCAEPSGRRTVLLEARHDLTATASAMQQSVMKQMNGNAYLGQQRLCFWHQRQTVLQWVQCLHWQPAACLLPSAALESESPPSKAQPGTYIQAQYNGKSHQASW